MAGLRAIFWKELADYFISWRFLILFALILAISVFAMQGAWTNIRAEITEETRYIFLTLFTFSGETTPPFLFFIALFVPLVGIMLGFDAINSENNSGTMSRLLAQPIYRDSVINGKFFAGVITITIMLFSIVLLMTGMGLRMIGVPPSSEELVRIMAFFGVGVIYGAFWLGLAMLFSILFRRVATSALASIGVWMFFVLFMLFNLNWAAANVLAPIGETVESQLRNAEMAFTLGRANPINLFQEGVAVLLVPQARSMTQYLHLQAVPSAISITQSLLIIWPQIVGLLAATALCFAGSYTKFMREEIRST